MSVPRRIYESLMEGSRAYAKWNYEASLNITRNRKTLLILCVLLLPILSVMVVEAADILGGKAAYAPVYHTTTLFLFAIPLGFVAGLIQGGLGASGGFVLTPALMSIGVKGIIAVGTMLFHTTAAAIMASLTHKKLGNVYVPLALVFIIGSFSGATLGGWINRAIYAIDPLLSDAFVSMVYAVILFFLGSYALSDYLKLRKGSAGDKPTTTTALALKLQSSKIPPRIRFDQDFVPGGRSLPGIVVACGGFFVGVLATIMGIGGGSITFSMYVYLFGVSTITTVGTGIFQVLLTATYASITQYLIYGFVFYTLAVGLFIGSLIGLQVASHATKVIKGVELRGFYALAILASFINRATVLPKKLGELGYIQISQPLALGIEAVGFWIFWVCIAIFTILFTSRFFGNIKALRAEG